MNRINTIGDVEAFLAALRCILDIDNYNNKNHSLPQLYINVITLRVVCLLLNGCQ